MSLNLSLNFRAALKSRRVLAMAPIIAAMVALPLAAPAFAQSSLDSSAAPPTDYAVPPPGGSLIEPSMPSGAASDDSVTDDSTPDDATAGDAPVTPGDVSPGAAASGDASTIPDDGAGPPVVVKNATPDTTSHHGWDRVDDVETDSESEDPTAKVLEVPQVVQSYSSQPSDGADQTAGPDQTADADQSAQDGDFPSPDEVGSIDEYQNEEDDSAVMGVYIVPVPFGPVGISPYAANTYHAIRVPGYMNQRGFLPGFVPGAPFGTVNVRGFGSGMNSAILRTSPMFPHTSMGYSGGMRFSGGTFGRMR
jgi:hypothetical protein